MRQLSVLETAAVVSIAGSVLAVAGPAFVKNLDASRLAEPVEGLRRIAAAATALADAQPQGHYPESVDLTPAKVPQGSAQRDPPETWEHPSWKALDFAFVRPHRYSFAFLSGSTPEGATFEARAHGDLDADGLWSTFILRGQKRTAAPAEVFNLEIDREIE